MPGPTGVATQAGSSAAATSASDRVDFLIVPLLGMRVARRSFAVHDGGVLGIEEPDAGALGVDVVDRRDAALARRLLHGRVAEGHQAEDVAAGRAADLAGAGLG